MLCILANRDGEATYEGVMQTFVELREEQRNGNGGQRSPEALVPSFDELNANPVCIFGQRGRANDTHLNDGTDCPERKATVGEVSKGQLKQQCPASTNLKKQPSFQDIEGRIAWHATGARPNQRNEKDMTRVSARVFGEKRVHW